MSDDLLDIDKLIDSIKLDDYIYDIKKDKALLACYKKDSQTKPKNKQVDLYLYDALQLNTENTNALHQSRYPNYIKFAVKSWEDYTKALTTHPNIRNLAIFSHGAPGCFYFNDLYIKPDEIAAKAIKDKKPLAKIYGNIHLEGCNCFGQSDAEFSSESTSQIRKAFAPLAPSQIMTGYTMYHHIQTIPIAKGTTLKNIAKTGSIPWQSYWKDYVLFPNLSAMSDDTVIKQEMTLIFEWCAVSSKKIFPDFTDAQTVLKQIDYKRMKEKGALVCRTTKQDIITSLPGEE